MSVKNKFPDPVADVKLVPKVAYFAPEGVAYFSPEWVAYFAPERWHTIVRIIQLTGTNPCTCPVCKKGRMVLVKVLPRIRSPGWISQSNTPAIH